MTQRDLERQAFLDAITADRYDHATRLVFADFLNENGYDAEAEEQRRWTPEWQRAWDWFEKLAAAVSLAEGGAESVEELVTPQQLIDAGSKTVAALSEQHSEGDQGTSILGGMGFWLRDWYNGDEYLPGTNLTEYVENEGESEEQTWETMDGESRSIVNRDVFWDNWTVVTRTNPRSTVDRFADREVFRCCY